MGYFKLARAICGVFLYCRLERNYPNLRTLAGGFNKPLHTGLFVRRKGSDSFAVEKLDQSRPFVYLGIRSAPALDCAFWCCMLAFGVCAELDN